MLYFWFSVYLNLRLRSGSRSNIWKPVEQKSMGVIQRQGAKNSLVLYLGVLIGGLSTLFIYPLDFGTYGLVQTCLDLVIFLTPIVTFGTTTLTLRFFPRFQQAGERDGGFLGFLLASTAIALLLSGLLFASFGNYFAAALEYLKFDLQVFRTYRWPLIVLLVVYVFILIFDNYIRNYNRIVIQSLFTNLLPKIGLPILILVLVYQGMSQAEFVWGYVAIYGFALLGLIFYAKLVTPFDFGIQPAVLREQHLLKDMSVYASYSVFGTMGAILATQMDSLMITTLIDTTNTGIYKVTAFMAVVVEIPARSLRAIASPIIARAWEEKDHPEIATIYQRSSATLGFVGTAIFVLMAINVVDIVSWTPKPEELLANLGIFYVLGMVKLIDLFTGVNSQIISFSDYFRFNIVAILILAVFNLVFNYIFIVYLGWGLMGVATATFISMTFYNTIKFIFIQIRMGLQPFTLETVKIILVGLLAFGVSFLPIGTGFSLLDVVLRSTLAALIFGAGLWYGGICPEIKDMILKGWDTAKAWWSSYRK